MERFTVILNAGDKDQTFKFENMKDARLFSLRSSQVKENKTVSIEITDNKVNQTPYHHYQIDGKVIKSNLINRSVSSYFQD